MLKALDLRGLLSLGVFSLLAPRSAAARSSARPVALPAALPALEPLQCPHGPWNAPGAKGCRGRVVGPNGSRAMKWRVPTGPNGRFFHRFVRVSRCLVDGGSCRLEKGRGRPRPGHASASQKNMSFFASSTVLGLRRCSTAIPSPQSTTSSKV